MAASASVAVRLFCVHGIADAISPCPVVIMVLQFKEDCFPGLGISNPLKQQQGHGW